MKYFKNLELARIYNVSEKAVRNWIDSVEKGKLELELFTYGERPFIANTSKNQQVIKDLVERGQKYKNSRSVKTVTVLPDFYKIYSPEQVFDILSNIDIHREIPHSYSYFDVGAEYWDKYAQRLLQEEGPNTLTRTVDLLRASTSCLENFVAGYPKVNIIDLGVGNCLPMRRMIEHFHEKGMLNRYIGLDISEEMLTLAKRNITAWFDGKVEFEGYTRDIRYERFADILATDSFGKSSDSKTINLFFLLGGTLVNFRSPDNALKAINDSMGRNDLVLYCEKLDSENSRRYFDFDYDAKVQTVPIQEKFILDLLNIDETLYEVEQLYDAEKRSRFIRIKLKVDLLISFEVNGIQKSIAISKGERILLWRARHQSALDVVEEFDRNDFDFQQVTISPEGEYCLLVAKLKTGVLD